MTKLAIALSSLVACTPLVAQATAVYGLAASGLNPPDFAIGAFGRSVTADLTNHQIPDIVALATEDGGGGREAAVLLGAPGVHNSAVLLANTADKQIRDVAVIRGGDPNDDRDALVLVTDQGLYRWCSGGVLTHFGGNNWINATRVEVGDVDGDGFAEAIGKMGNASFGNPQNVRCTSIGGVEAWMVNTGAPILDLAVVDWVNGPGPVRDEVAVVHQNAVHFIVDGVLEPGLSVTLPLCESARIVAMRTAGGSVRLVLGVTDASGASMLVTIMPGSAGLACRPVGREIGSLTVVEDDQVRGVVAAIATNANLIHFVHDEATWPAEAFAPGSNLRSAPQPANGAADARLLDLDADGDLDLFASTLGTGFLVARMPGNDPFGGGRPVLVEIEPHQYELQFPAWATDIETLHFQFLTTWEDEEVSAMAMSPIGLERTFTPGTGSITLGVNDWPTKGCMIQGPVVTLVRAAERTANGSEVLRRGPFRALIWSIDPREKTFLLNLLAALLNQPVTQPSGPSTSESLVYGYMDYPVVIGYPPMVATPPQEGIVPGAVEPPQLPPPDPDPDPEQPPVAGEPEGD